jgi:hypothetical protein
LESLPDAVGVGDCLADVRLDPRLRVRGIAGKACLPSQYGQ